MELVFVCLYCDPVPDNNKILNVCFVAAAQFMFDRTRQPKMSAFFDEENEIAEEGESNRESCKQVKDPEMFQQLGLSEVDEARLRSCLEEIHNVIGDSVPEQILIDTVLRNEFNLDKALDAVLSNAASAAEKPPAGEFCATILNESTAFHNKLCVLSLLFYTALHVSAYKQAIFKCLLTNHEKVKLVSYFSVDPPSHDIT
jgi:hypothetical protein